MNLGFSYRVKKQMLHLLGPVYKFEMTLVKRGICKTTKIQNEEILAIVT